MRIAEAALILALTASIAVAQHDAASGNTGHQFLLDWGQSGISTAGHFLDPQGVAVDSEGNVYVTDLGNARVQKFDNNGVFLDAWTGSGDSGAIFKAPTGIAVYEDHVFVVDSQLNSVQKFGTNGDYILRWGLADDGSGLLLPNGIAASSNGTILVVDTGHHRVLSFTPNGEYVSEFGSSGTADDEFISPMGITIDNNNNVYVSDPGSSSIKKFNSVGSFVDIFDSSVGGLQVGPQGLQIDPDGNLYVADYNNDRLLRLDSRGTAISVFGTTGIGAGEFKMPKDVALDSDGNLFIVDSNGHRIQKFSTPIKHIISEAEQRQAEQVPVQQPVQAPPRQEYNLPPVNPVPGDLTKPVITPPNDMVIEATGVLTPVNVGQAIVSDESGIKSLVNNAPDEFTLGTNTVIWTAIDGAGNMAIATQSVIVTDTIPPTISDASSVVAEATSPDRNQIVLEPPVASDVVGVISLESDAPEYYTIGQTVITWTATDIAGNTASTSQTVDIVDTTSPTLHVPEDIALEAASVGEDGVFLGEPTVIDNGRIISVTNDSPEHFDLGNTTVTWIASDASGNTATGQQTVLITDATSPEFEHVDDVIFEAVSAESNDINIVPPKVNDIQNITLTSDAPESFPLGNSTVTWTATDDSGNSATLVQTISVVDTTIPVLTAPADVTVEAAGSDGSSVDLGEVTADDVTGISLVTNDSPDVFLLGDTVVTWTVHDGSGNTATALQTVSVLDTTSPVIFAPNDITAEASNMDANHVDIGQPTVQDLVEVVSITNDAPMAYPIGVTTVTWTAEDSAGNTASDSQIITVADTVSPEITSPDDLVVEATGPDGEVLSIGDAIASDLIGIRDVSNDAPELFQLGSTTVTWTATDLHGNSATSVQTITIVDSTAPTIDVPADVSVEAQGPQFSTADIGMAQAYDIVGVLSITNDAPDLFGIGETLVTWTATDAAGNYVRESQIITVTDNTIPEITAPSDVTVEADSADDNIILLSDANATDIVGVLSITNDAPDLFGIGETLVTWTATDAAGNSATDVQSVFVVDTTAPILQAPPSVTVEATSQFESAVEYGTATASDDVGVTSVTNDAPDVFPLGLTSITWTAADAAGNERSAIQQISVVDTTAPYITPPNDVMLEAGSSDGNIVDIGQADASDLVLLESVTHDAPDNFSLGSTTITWTAVDSTGNTATSTQIVTLLDTTPPNIVAPADYTLEAESKDGSTAVQTIPPDYTDSVGPVTITNNAPAVFPLGETLVTWTATDAAGNSATDSQTVIVIDTIPPEIQVPDNVVSEALSELENTVDIGMAQAQDLVDIMSVSSDAPEVFPYGTTTVTWTATDTSGNIATGTQEIIIVDTISPVLTLPPDVTAEAASITENPVLIGTAEADDVIGISSLANDAPDLFPLGDTLVTWTAVDLDGNTASAVQTVTLVDTTAPELHVPDDVIVDASSMQTIVDIGVATGSDLIDGSPVVENNSPESFELGTTMVTWTAHDTFGNSASYEQTITVLACGRDADYYNPIVGSADDDVLKGTDQPDLVFALDGDDIVSGKKGNDCIFGGEGNDIIFGDQGNDELHGDQGNDVLKGQSGDDIILGGTGADIIDGGYDNDSCSTESDTDDLIAKCEIS